jgi:hypothetical protein
MLLSIAAISAPTAGESREDRPERRRWRSHLAGLVRHGCKRRRRYGDGRPQGAAAIPSDACRAAMPWWARAAGASGLRAAGALIRPTLQLARPLPLAPSQSPQLLPCEHHASDGRESPGYSLAASR